MRNMIRLVATALVATTFVGAAGADGPGASTASTTNSLFASDGRMYTAALHGQHTVLSLWKLTRKVRRSVVHGRFGFPVPTTDGVGEGISHDGRTLVLAAGSSRFAVLDSRSLRIRRSVQLPGAFTYDALSPHGRTLFLIQHASPTSAHYYVRAYDLRQGRLLDQIVFDRREEGVAMSGMPVARATGPSGRWVYTLYVRRKGSLFVHALDSVDRHAFCVDLPRRPSVYAHMRLTLSPRKLVVGTTVKRLAVIDTKTLRLRA